MFPVVLCPEWNYRKHPQYGTIMPKRETELMGTLVTDKVASATIAIDTRTAHQKLFGELTPPGHEYYAGHYRGEDFRCLKNCSVGVAQDTRVGAPPHRVALGMLRLSRAIRDTISALDKECPITTNQELRLLVQFIGNSFVDFLTIHPYVDGNGHAARTILCAIMLHYGFRPVWTLDSHPQEPDYSDFIVRYRNGDTEPLKQHILQWITG
jgi:fido (protein-threonine AMPylation protein)